MTVDLSEIEALAEQISTQWNHYYIGVEHLFAALCVSDPTTQKVLKLHGISPHLLLSEMQERFANALDRHYWNGFRHTPRCQALMHHLVQHKLRAAPEILVEILLERHNLAVGLLAEYRVDVESLLSALKNGETASLSSALPSVKTSLPLSSHEIEILHQLFHDRPSIEVLHELPAGIHETRLYCVAVDSEQQSAKIFVHISDSTSIFNEYKAHQQKQLAYFQPNIPTITGLPAFSSDGKLAGLVYQIPSNACTTLLETLQHSEQDGALDAIQQTYKMLSGWAKKSTQQEYNIGSLYPAYLPPALFMEYIHPDTRQTSTIIEPSLDPAWVWEVKEGDVVLFKDWFIESINHREHSILISDIAQSTTALIRHIDPDALDSFSQGQGIRQITAVITNLRENRLFETLADLQPDFDVLTEQIEAFNRQFLNPVHLLKRLAPYTVTGHVAYAHGNVAPGMMLFIPGTEPTLMDFSKVRPAPIYLDWAFFELMLWAQLLPDHISPEWSGLHKMIWQQELPLMHSVATNFRAEFGDMAWQHYCISIILVGWWILGQSGLPLYLRRTIFLRMLRAVEEMGI